MVRNYKLNSSHCLFALFVIGNNFSSFSWSESHSTFVKHPSAVHVLVLSVHMFVFNSIYSNCLIFSLSILVINVLKKSDYHGYKKFLTFCVLRNSLGDYFVNALRALYFIVTFICLPFCVGLNLQAFGFI